MNKKATNKIFNTASRSKPNGEAVLKFVTAARDGNLAFLKAGIRTFGDSIINLGDMSGTTALGMAAVWGQTECIKALIKAKADLNKPDKTGETPAMKAAWHKEPQALKLLLEAGAQTDVQDNSGRTAVHWAIKCAKNPAAAECLTLLAAHNARLDIEDNNGDAPLLEATRQENYYYGYLGCLEILLKHKIDVNTHNSKSGSTALITATNHGNAPVMTYLLDKGAKIDARDKNGQTALFHAAGHIHTHCIDLLLDRGAKLEARDSVKWTPLHRAVYNGKPIGVFKLLERGANLNAKSQNKQTPYDIAVFYQKQDMLKALAEWPARKDEIELGFFKTGTQKPISAPKGGLKLQKRQGNG